MAERLLKGCKVHWQWSCQHVTEKELSTEERKDVRPNCFKYSDSWQLYKYNSLFWTALWIWPVAELLKTIPTLCKTDEAKLIDEKCNCMVKCKALGTMVDLLWSPKNALYSKSFLTMEESIWEQCPSSTNAVEQRNRDCKSDTPQFLKLATMKIYKVDNVTCLKHIAIEDSSYFIIL